MLPHFKSIERTSEAIGENDTRGRQGPVTRWRGRAAVMGTFWVFLFVVCCLRCFVSLFDFLWIFGFVLYHVFLFVFGFFVEYVFFPFLLHAG